MSTPREPAAEVGGLAGIPATRIRHRCVGTHRAAHEHPDESRSGKRYGQ
ncbi:hypothetical protein I546_4490 [Mycobacterium kansasii 732]|nr:hypothetical protein I546_4490 [Mycobacterium kansasii 732]